ncbi:MAG: hypothetical protein HBSAPP02_16930 [Phycisphaerae bacterium]|nr:MAG: glycosyltransferase family 39 protein [Planctomycetia bacterium]RIK67736.1 MAG: hypothetical protein DCC66_11125 [Planctomycetota bacterium]GJQ26661.1 MAG: hypothetical protein HBSAPP02_16930 [Phycisphaerae bacterium]
MDAQKNKSAEHPPGELNAAQRGVIAASIAIFLVALAVRAAFLYATPDRSWPQSVLYEGDAPLWIRYAQAIRAGKPFELNLPIHAPGLAYALAFLWPGSLEGPATGQGFIALKVVWCAMGAASCGGLFLVARDMFNARIAVVAALLSALSFALTIQSTSLNNEAPYTLLLIFLVGLTGSVAARPNRWRLVVWAVMNALAALVRAEHTLLVVLWGAWLAWHWRSDGTSQAAGAQSRGVVSARSENRASGARVGPWIVVNRLALMGAIFVIAPLPWNVRAYRAIQRFNETTAGPIDYPGAPVAWRPDAQAYLEDLPAFVREPCFRVISEQARAASREEVDKPFVQAFFSEQMRYVPRPLSPYVFISAQGPLAFALANRPGGDGGFSTEPLGGADTLNFADPRHLRLVQDGYRVGWENLTRPGEARRLITSKLSLFAAGWTHGLMLTNWPAGLVGTRRPVDQFAADNIPPGWSTAVLGLGMVGAGICLLRRRGGVWILVVVYKLVIAAAFFGYARQAVSILPVLYVLVAAALDTLLLRHVAKWFVGWPGRLKLTALGASIGLLLMNQAGRRIDYDVIGDAVSAPQWGRGAFESHEPLRIELVFR